VDASEMNKKNVRQFGPGGHVFSITGGGILSTPTNLPTCQRSPRFLRNHHHGSGSTWRACSHYWFASRIFPSLNSKAHAALSQGASGGIGMETSRLFLGALMVNFVCV
jgi:hypothetical protein